jgi:hypothetical protein
LYTHTFAIYIGEKWNAAPCVPPFTKLRRSQGGGLRGSHRCGQTELDLQLASCVHPSAQERNVPQQYAVPRRLHGRLECLSLAALCARGSKTGQRPLSALAQPSSTAGLGAGYRVRAGGRLAAPASPSACREQADRARHGACIHPVRSRLWPHIQRRGRNH